MYRWDPPRAVGLSYRLPTTLRPRSSPFPRVPQSRCMGQVPRGTRAHEPRGSRYLRHPPAPPASTASCRRTPPRRPRRSGMPCCALAGFVECRGHWGREKHVPCRMTASVAMGGPVDPGRRFSLGIKWHDIGCLCFESLSHGTLALVGVRQPVYTRYGAIRYRILDWNDCSSSLWLPSCSPRFPVF